MPPLRKGDGRSDRPWFGARHLRVLARIARLRVITAAQAYYLIDAYDGVSLRAVEKGLERLAKHGYVSRELVEPRRGAVSAVFYRLTTKGAFLVTRTPPRSLFARPPQPILRYLLFRNTVYAQARADGWRIASPTYSSAANVPEYLRLFNDWARSAHRAHVADLRLSGGRVSGRDRAEEALARLDRFLPTKLTFEFLFKLDPSGGRATDVVLLIIDDPRRAIYRTQQSPRAAALQRLDAIEAAKEESVPAPPRRTLPPRPGPQWDDLPNVNPPGLRLLLRDASTHYDLVKRELFRVSKRLTMWRSRLNAEGSLFAGLLGSDSLYPDLWAIRYAYDRRELPKTVAARARADPASTPPTAAERAASGSRPAAPTAAPLEKNA